MPTDPFFIAQGSSDIHFLPQMANRHGLIAGATGTGKTVTLRVLAENFSAIGVPVFMADVKGDLSGLAKPGADSPKVKERAEQMQALLNGWARVLKVRLDAPATGPADMLAFLSEGRSGEASTMSGIDEDHLIERVIAARAKLGVTTKNAELLTLLESDFEGLTMSEVKKAASKATKRTAAAER